MFNTLHIQSDSWTLRALNCHEYLTLVVRVVNSSRNTDSIAKNRVLNLPDKVEPTFLDVVPGGGLEEHDVGDEADGGGAPLRRVRVDPHLLLRGDGAVDADGGRRRRVQVGRPSHVALGMRCMTGTWVDHRT